jgi:hypothetical protein
MKSDVPRISAGSLSTLFRCSFRLAGRLTEEQTSRRGADPSMRLWSALNEALRAAHDHSWDLSSPLEEAIDSAQLRVAPTALSVEEAEVYRRSMASYLDAFGDDEIAAIHPKAGEPLKRRVHTNPVFDLTGRADLLFAYEDQPPLIRRLSLRGSPQPRHNDSGEDSYRSNESVEVGIADMALAVLLGLEKSSVRNDIVLRSETLWLAANSQVTTTQVTVADLAQFRSHLYVLIETAFADPAPEPGWWCTSCERLSHCPAISTEQATTLLERFSAAVI